MNTDKAPTETLQDLADRLYQAEIDCRPIPPLTDDVPGLSLEDAYQIQRMNIERRLRAGERIIGHKIGLTGKPMQIKFGVNEPDYGHLMNTMQLRADEPLDLSPLIDPQIEVEPAFILQSELRGPGLTVDDVLAATDFVVACYEIIDSRIIDWQIKLQDTVADNGSSARFVLGQEKVRPHGLALDNLDTHLEFDGKLAEKGNTSAILGHPAKGIAWLGNKLAEFGIILEAGHIVLPGTCIRSFRLNGHSRVRGSIEGLGSVSLDITGDPAVPNFDE